MSTIIVARIVSPFAYEHQFFMRINIMKKLFAAIIIFECLAMKVLAQEQPSGDNVYKRKNFFSDVEVYAGAGIAFLRGSAARSDKTHERKLKMSYCYGIALNHKLGNKLKLNSKLFFEKKGGISEITGTYFDQVTQTFKEAKAEIDDSYYYYTFSPSILYAIGKGKTNAGLGFYVAYLTKQTEKQTTFIPGAGRPSINNMTKYYEHFDWGLAISVSHSVNVHPKFNLNFQLLNTLGFVNVIRNPFEGKVIQTTNTSLLIGISKAK